MIFMHNKYILFQMIFKRKARYIYTIYIYAVICAHKLRFPLQTPLEITAQTQDSRDEGKGWEKLQKKTEKEGCVRPLSQS